MGRAVNISKLSRAARAKAKAAGYDLSTGERSGRKRDTSHGDISEGTVSSGEVTYTYNLPREKPTPEPTIAYREPVGGGEREYLGNRFPVPPNRMPTEVFTENTISMQQRPQSFLIPQSQNVRTIEKRGQITGYEDTGQQTSVLIRPGFKLERQSLEKQMNERAYVTQVEARRVQVDEPRYLKTWSKDTETVKPSFFGLFDEPGFEYTRKLEATFERKAAEGDIVGSRQKIAGQSYNALTPQGVFYNLINVPVKMVNRPVTTVATALAFTAGSSALTAGSYFTGGQFAYGATGFYTAASAEKERQEGGTGSKTLGQLTFIAGASVATYGAIKLYKATRPTRIEYGTQLISKGQFKGTKDIFKPKYKQDTFIGQTKGDSILEGKAYKEVFFSQKGQPTQRVVEYGNKVYEITERATTQDIKIFSKSGKYLGQDFKYIEPGQTINARIIPQVTKREIFSQKENMFSSQVAAKEFATGAYSKTIRSGTKTTDIKLKLNDVYLRNIIASDEIITTRTYQGGKVSVKGLDYKIVGGKLVSGQTISNKGEFVFTDKPSSLRDYNYIETSGEGLLTDIKVVQPRVYETGNYVRTATGTVTITSGTSLKSIFNIGKKASLGSTKTYLKPMISIAPTTPSSLSATIPTTVLEPKTTQILPMFTISTTRSRYQSNLLRQTPNIKLLSGQKQFPNIKLSQESYTKLIPNVKTVPTITTIPKVKTISDTKQVQDVKLISESGLTTNISMPNVEPIRPTVIPTTITPLFPKLPSIYTYDYTRKSRRRKRVKAYRTPTLTEELVGYVKMPALKVYTGFEPRGRV